MTDDPRRHIPRTDDLLTDDEIVAVRTRLGDNVVRSAILDAQQAARSGLIPPAEVRSRILDDLSRRAPTTLRPVLNATGVVIHTNLGRAPLSAAARAAIDTAAGYVDVELDLADGLRSKRGTSARAALLRVCPTAGDALIVNNGAAALVLATTTFAAGREVVISRGEMIEIGAGFRLTDLIASTGARLREVGTTNRTHLADYATAIAEGDVGCVLKVHPSNYRVSGFTADVPVDQLRNLCHDNDIPLINDLGSGLLQPDPALPDEPDAATALTAGADLVIASGDKLFGGPQAGILLGDATLIARLARHPLARAVRTDKLTLAAVEATLDGPEPPVQRYLHADPDVLRRRAESLGGALGFPVVAHDGRVGGGGAPGVELPGWAVRLPESVAAPLRLGDPAILTRTHDGACLLDLRCIEAADDGRVGDAVLRALGPTPAGTG